MAKPSRKEFKSIDCNSLTIRDLEAISNYVIMNGGAGFPEFVNARKELFKHKCPKCDGLGYEVITYNAYPSGLPDSGWVDDMQEFKAECNLCNGNGFTKEKFIAKPVKVEYVKA